MPRPCAEHGRFGLRRSRAKPTTEAFVTHRAVHSRPNTFVGFADCFLRSVCFRPLRRVKNENRPETAERKQIMKLEEVNQKTKEAVDFLVAALESGQSEVLTQYLAAIAKFHTYSFGNIMLDRAAEAGCDQCCRGPCLELAGPFHSPRRTRDFHPGSDGRSQANYESR